jgi:hypothetical protein
MGCEGGPSVGRFVGRPRDGLPGRRRSGYLALKRLTGQHLVDRFRDCARSVRVGMNPIRKPSVLSLRDSVGILRAVDPSTSNRRRFEHATDPKY